MALTFTDQENNFVSGASTYLILKAHDLITDPTFIVPKAVNAFKDQGKGSNEPHSKRAACITGNALHSQSNK